MTVASSTVKSSEARKDIMARPDLYISADVEADGPIPGRYSMLSFGLVVVGTYDGTTFERAEVGAKTFYTELAPISAEFIPEALAVSGLDRDRLIREAPDAVSAMTDAARWVREMAEQAGARPVLAAYPASFDWMWLYWYFVAFAVGGSPFGFSDCLDIKTFFAARSRNSWAGATKRSMPRHLHSKRPHTHHALDDAIEQGELFANLFGWEPAED